MSKKHTLCTARKSQPVVRSRRPHNKSRNGCQNCKKRHLKCDEQGPSCANCIARGTSSTCVYPKTSPTPSQDIPCSPSSESATQLTTSDASESHRLLELELMHRWSTTTYKSICTGPEDEYYIQSELPRWALKHDFLLNGIFSMSALEAAINVKDEAESALYIRAAMDYYDRGSGTFRTQLGNITQENVHCLYLFSFMALAINMALPQCIRGWSDDQPQQTVIGRIGVLLDLFIGSASIATNNVDRMIGSPAAPMFIGAAAKLKEVPSAALDSTTDAALARLVFIVEGAILNFKHSSLDLDTASVRCGIYRKAVEKLRICFLFEKEESVKSLCVAFPSLAGHDFAMAVKSSEPIALFILLHWAVLLERVGKVTWWARSVGRSMVQEISDVLVYAQFQLNSNLIMTSQWRDGIAWVREQVGLPMLK